MVWPGVGKGLRSMGRVGWPRGRTQGLSEVGEFGLVFRWKALILGWGEPDLG